MPLPERKKPATQPLFLKGSKSPILFVTVCTDKRKKILAKREIHSIIRDAWAEADHWLVGRYVIMPDHLHLFCSPAKMEHVSVKKWIAYWKSLASNVWPDAAEHPIWQRAGWDTQLRKGESYGAKWEYVRRNPVRHGLVKESNLWPFQGEMHILHWHD